MRPINLNDSIAALATPLAESALAVIRVSGKDCIARLSPAFKGKYNLISLEGGRIIPGWLTDPAKDNKPLDRITAAVFREPHSYTGENTVELYVHGSPAGIERILKLLFNLGFRQAAPGEFTMRAFLNGKMDLTRAEAVRELIAAKTETGVSLALKRLNGGVADRITDIKDNLIQTAAKMEAVLDYPEGEDGADFDGIFPEELDPVLQGLKDLADTYRIGRMLREGIKIAIAGQTNAGKSSLFNLFLREDRAIVSPIHGTTRDYIESWISIDGIPISLIDTAGLRDSTDPLEQESMRRTTKLLAEADIILHVFDGCEPLISDNTPFQALPGGNARIISIWNKIDINGNPAPAGFLPLSVKTMEGFKALEQAIVETIQKDRGIRSHSLENLDMPVIDSLRQKQLLDEAITALSEARTGLEQKHPIDLVAQDISEALRSLGEITGEITTDDILAAVFSRFCVGK